MKEKNLHSLERHSLHGDLSEDFNWIKGINKGNLDEVLLLKTDVRTLSSGCKLEKFKFRKEID